MLYVRNGLNEERKFYLKVHSLMWLSNTIFSTINSLGLTAKCLKYKCRSFIQGIF
uniref:Uncharacterized protein n=1 Tax=Meloidogyne enterolobii TaxID=390850 RepID=A0A6V7VNR3_MELEN|nr:unnamed protein product [Meloidogyne enterolobii]